MSQTIFMTASTGKEISRRLREARSAEYPSIEAGYAHVKKFTDISKGAYTHHENGTRIPKRTYLEAYSRAFNVPLDWLMVVDGLSQKRDHEQSAYGTTLSADVNNNERNGPLQRVRVTHNVPLIGKAEAGAFRAMFNDNIPVETFIPIDAPEFEGVELFAYEVSGTSMNEVFREGDRVICQAFAPNDLRDRDFVILQDTKGPLAEISIKEFRIGNKGQWEFWPRSTDTRWQEPITIPERNDYQQSGIEIIGIVLFEAPAPIRRVGRLAVRP